MVLNENYLGNPNDDNSHKGYLHCTCIFLRVFTIPKNVDCRVLLVQIFIKGEWLWLSW